MSTAFIIEKDTVLCCQTPTGWQPLSIDLSAESDCKEPPYQLGRVELLESLAPSHWQQSEHGQEDNSSLSFEATSLTANDAPAAYAISYHYAKTNQLTLPTIRDDIESISAAINQTDIQANDADDNGAINAFISYRQLLTQIPVALADQISQAMQLLRWQADTQFCSRCGAAVCAADSGERAMVCSVCRLRQYPRVQPCVITAITRPNPKSGEMQILLAHHHRYGQTTLPLQYGLIAGFVEVGESLEHAVVREVFEEVGIRLSHIRYVSSQPWPFPSNLMLGFRANYDSGDLVLQEDELSHADFFDLSDLPKIPFKGSIAYDLIAQIAEEQGVTLA
ncbi:NAD(+) diphosphatase [uncultured Psychrobacter sp.]|uniref:NAD(+) diphosphatase n=1 Tax=uncultured Psychrobacter sp. TaxID=259303 RepID=UPI002638E019|nr:NAD(+) diphosphatase [uncultured Psychrobacter sp.]